MVDGSVAEMVACDCQELRRLDDEGDPSPHAGAADQNGPGDGAASAAQPAPLQRATQTTPPAT